MHKNMSQTKNKLTASSELEHQKSDKILSEINLDEDSGLGVSGYSHDSLSDKDSAQSKGPHETSKQKEAEEQDYLDSGFESSIHPEQLLDPKEMVQRIHEPMLAEFEQMHLTDSKQQYTTDSRPNYDILREIWSQDEDGETQAHIAISSGAQTLTRNIIDCAPYPALLDIENVFGQSPIHLAVLMGQSMIVRHLLISGAKATVRDCEGNTPLHLACRSNDSHSVAAILNPISSAELKSYRSSDQSSKYQRIPIDLEQRNYFGEHCIHIAVQNNAIDILKHLLNAGADINAREGRKGYSPLHIAVENQNEKMVQFLLKHGAEKLNVETLTYGQITAYQLANEFDSVKIMKHLAEFGCEQLLYPESDYDDSTDGSDMDSDDD